MEKRKVTNVVAKRLRKGCVSIYSYIVDSCILEKCDLRVFYKRKEMIVPYESLKTHFQMHKKKYGDARRPSEYTLYDFLFVPTTEEAFT